MDDLIKNILPAIALAAPSVSPAERKALIELADMGYTNSAVELKEPHLLTADQSAAADDVDKATGNPFKKIHLKKGDPISRIPFSEDELRSILSVAETDTVIGGMVIAAACSGMRRADCARLHWSDVDLAEGYIIGRSSKTKKTITIPILAPLRKVLEKLTHNSGYCFPNAAEMLLTNPDGLNWRLAKLVKKAGVKLPAKPLLVDQQGKRAPSKIGFHRFKSTFVTMSLDAGIPIAIVQKIVGNSDLRVLLRHYHRPDKRLCQIKWNASCQRF